jgi:hypothetical protein
LKQNKNKTNSTLINLYFSSGTFPISLLKIAKAIPVFKGGSPFEVENERL